MRKYLHSQHPWLHTTPSLLPPNPQLQPPTVPNSLPHFACCARQGQCRAAHAHQWILSTHPLVVSFPFRADQSSANNTNPFGQSICQDLEEKHFEAVQTHTKMHSIVQHWPVSATGEGLTPPTEPGSAPFPQGLAYLPNTKLFYWPKQTTETFYMLLLPALSSVHCLTLSLPHKKHLLTEACSALSRKHLPTAAQLGLTMEQGWQLHGLLKDM